MNVFYRPGAGNRAFRSLYAMPLLTLAPAALLAQNVEISSWEDLNNIRNNLTADYILTQDLGPADAGYDTYASPTANEGAGWLPIGDSSTFFAGEFDGQGHTITGLFIDRPESSVGLFGGVLFGTIRDLGIVDADITSGGNYVGSVAGFLRGSLINCWGTGKVTGGSDQVGGLVGSGRVVMENCWADVDVTSTSWVGGLVGFNQIESVVTNSYSIGSATALRASGASHAGGLVADLMGTINTSYAATAVRAFETGVEGGLVADIGAAGSVDDSYWDSVIAGTNTSEGGGTPLTTAQMKGAAAATHMSGLDFVSVWITVEEGVAIDGVVPEADGYPILRNLPIEPQLAAQAPLIPVDARENGDFDNDGCVGFADFIFLLENWGTPVDGVDMGFPDFIALLENWGEGC